MARERLTIFQIMSLKPKRESDEGLVRPRPGRFLGLAFVAVGEALGQNDFIRAKTGVDPFSNQQISGVERAISGVSAASTILPVNRVIKLRQFFKAKKFAKALSKASRTKPLTQAEVDEALKISRFEGLKVRVDIKDLKGDHFVGGPHIHIEELHIRVEAGVTVTP